jgi:hypothetical protein
MNDRDFIELLNLYIDHEISPEDALRLEAEVISRPDRREVYHQYCRMQKACSMLADKFAEEPEAAVEVRRSSWGISPLMAGLAAACLIAALGLRWSGVIATSGSVATVPAPAATLAHNAPAADAAMQAVFKVRGPAVQASNAPQASFVSYSPQLQAAQLNWIGDLRFSPVVSSSGAELHLAPKAELKATVLTDSQNGHDAQQAGEMAAFRFQR